MHKQAPRADWPPLLTPRTGGSGPAGKEHAGPFISIFTFNGAGFLRERLSLLPFALYRKAAILRQLGLMAAAPGNAGGGSQRNSA